MQPFGARTIHVLSRLGSREVSIERKIPKSKKKRPPHRDQDTNKTQKKEENNKTIYSMFLMISECAISGEVERDCKQIPNVHRRHVVYGENKVDKEVNQWGFILYTVL